jgi:hypothetical protein
MLVTPRGERATRDTPHTLRPQPHGRRKVTRGQPHCPTGMHGDFTRSYQ